ncbi:MAG: class I SAM-dependent methyltransferase [Gemmatimonadaceae bacterium]
MLKTLDLVFETGTIETDAEGNRIEISSHISKEQGLFLQKLYDQVKPSRSLEVGLAYGISTLFILEKCRENNCAEKSHIVIEPFSWGDAAEYNIKKEGLERYIDIRKDLSDVVIPTMYLNQERIQFAFVDTTKIFDTVMQDFYFIDKILDVGGIVVFDDATLGGINVVMRFVRSLPHYEMIDKFEKVRVSKAYDLGAGFFEKLLSILPFQAKYLGFYSLKTSRQLGINYRCIAFRKLSNDPRTWDWDVPF